MGRLIRELVEEIRCLDPLLGPDALIVLRAHDVVLWSHKITSQLLKTENNRHRSQPPDAVPANVSGRWGWGGNEGLPRR